MTELRDERSPLELEGPEGLVASRGSHAPSHRRSGPAGDGPSRRWMTGFFGILAVVLVLAAGLAYVGLSTVRSSRAGRVISTITDPAEPGFEALVEPSPTLVAFDEGADGSLRSVAVMSLNAGDQGGSMFLLPRSSLAGALKDAPTIAGVYIYAKEPEEARASVQDAVTMGISEVAPIDHARWAELVAPVAPLTIENPTAVGSFPAGTISLAAADVDAWLDASNEGDTELDGLKRQELFWRAWISAVGKSTDPAVIPGETDSGLGRFVRGLAHGTLRVEQLPVDPTTDPLGGVHYKPDLDATRALVNEMVPFPTGSLQSPRVRVRLLDGTGDQQHVGRVAPMLIPADAEIVVAGNAGNFKYTTTEVRYHDPIVKAKAEALQKALGVGKVVEDPRPTEAFDVTIILGTDV